MGLSLEIDSDTVVASDHVRVHGVTFSSDLSPDKHVSGVCAACFYWLRRIRRSLHGRRICEDACPRLCHSPGGLYCSMVGLLAGALRSVTDGLQRVLHAAARLVSGTRK